MTDKYRVKANKELFSAWEGLAQELSGFKSIVQNDIELSTEQLTQFNQMVYQFHNKLETLKAKVNDHIKSN